MPKKRKRLVVWLTFQSGLKIVFSAILVALLVMIYAYKLPATETWTEWTQPLAGKTIALDAGHGGPDGGASSKSGVIEKDINLIISLYVRDYLQQAGAIVVMTREMDKDLANPDTKGYSKRKTEDLLKRAEFVIQKKRICFSASISIASLHQSGGEPRHFITLIIKIITVWHLSYKRR